MAKISTKERFKIPMLWYGDVLNDRYKGTKINKLGSHIDIAASLLGQLNIDYTNFDLSTNLFNKSAYLIPMHFQKALV